MTSSSTRSSVIDSIIAGGCSFTWGDELKNRDNRFVNLVAKSMGVKLFDFSGKGYSNEAIVLNLTEGILDVVKTKQVVPEKTLVLVNFTFASRLSYFSAEAKGWFSTHLYRGNVDVARRLIVQNGSDRYSLFEKLYHPQEIKLFYEDHTHPLFLLYNTYAKIHRVQTLMRLYNFNYVLMFSCRDTLKLVMDGAKDLDILLENSYSDDGFKSFQNIINDVDKTKIFKVPFVNYSEDKKYPFGPRKHPLEQAHAQYATLLKDHIDETFF